MNGHPSRSVQTRFGGDCNLLPVYTVEKNSESRFSKLFDAGHRFSVSHYGGLRR
jgi:hypothetical protein